MAQQPYTSISLREHRDILQAQARRDIAQARHLKRLLQVAAGRASAPGVDYALDWLPIISRRARRTLARVARINQVLQA